MSFFFTYMSGSSRRRSLAPPGTRLPPGGVPPADNTGNESAAQQIVREWELHVEVNKQYYSPCYLWTLAARKAAAYTDRERAITSTSARACTAT